MTHFFWNTRGNLIKVDKDSLVNEMLEKGFIRASQEDTEKYNPGDYHPAYDRGEQPLVKISQPMAQEVNSQDDNTWHWIEV